MGQYFNQHKPVGLALLEDYEIEENIQDDEDDQYLHDGLTKARTGIDHVCPRCDAVTSVAGVDPYCNECNWDSLTDVCASTTKCAA